MTELQSALRVNRYISGILLLTFACAKLVSANGRAGILQELDPVFSMSFQNLFWAVGTLEAIVAIICIFAHNEVVPSILLASCSTGFVVYRLGLKWVNYHKTCPCLGNLLGTLHISDGVADLLALIVLAYLLLGSYSTLLWLWWVKSRNSPNPPASSRSVAHI